jgi:hypothetical protein
MPKFFINFQDANGLITKDDEGIDLLGLEAARQVALMSAREIIADNIKFESPHPLAAIIITDESGRGVMTLPAKEVLPEPLK